MYCQWLLANLGICGKDSQFFLYDLLRDRYQLGSVYAFFGAKEIRHITLIRHEEDQTGSPLGSTRGNSNPTLFVCGEVTILFGKKQVQWNFGLVFREKF